MTFLDCWRTSFCVTTIIKIVNNYTNDKQTFGASLALDEDSPYTNSCLFTLDRLPFLLLLRKNYFSSSPKTSQQSVGKPYCTLLVFNSPWHDCPLFVFNSPCESCVMCILHLSVLRPTRKSQLQYQ